MPSKLIVLFNIGGFRRPLGILNTRGGFRAAVQRTRSNVKGLDQH